MARSLPDTRVLLLRGRKSKPIGRLSGKAMETLKCSSWAEAEGVALKKKDCIGFAFNRENDIRTNMKLKRNKETETAKTEVQQLQTQHNILKLKIKRTDDEEKELKELPWKIDDKKMELESLQNSDMCEILDQVQGSATADQQLWISPGLKNLKKLQDRQKTLALKTPRTDDEKTELEKLRLNIDTGFGLIFSKLQELQNRHEILESKMTLTNGDKNELTDDETKELTELRSQLKHSKYYRPAMWLENLKSSEPLKPGILEGDSEVTHEVTFISVSQTEEEEEEEEEAEAQEAKEEDEDDAEDDTAQEPEDQEDDGEDEEGEETEETKEPAITEENADEPQPEQKEIESQEATMYDSKWQIYGT